MTIDAATVHIPRLGYYKARVVKGGPNVPVWITERGERDPETGEPLEDIEILVEVAGQLVEREDRKERAIININLFGEPIDQATYDYMTADAEWCRKHAPTEPPANPFKPIDLDAMAPVTVKGRKGNHARRD